MNLRILIIGSLAIALGLATKASCLWDWIDPVMGCGSFLFAAWAMYEAREARAAIEGNAMAAKSYEVTVGLFEGYDDCVSVHTKQEVEETIKAWMDERLQGKAPILQGMVEPTTMIYPVRNNDESGDRVISEPSCVFWGSLSPKYDQNREDQEVLSTLEHLAVYLGRKLNQKRVYYKYCNKQYTVDIGAE